jgi:hypothetical protein
METFSMVPLVDKVDLQSLFRVLFAQAIPVVGHAQKTVKYDQGPALAQDV